MNEPSSLGRSPTQSSSTEEDPWGSPSESPGASNESSRLIRIPGKQASAELALKIPWADDRLDPNGYYNVMGLRTDKAWTMGEIHRAFRDSAKFLHPDHGGNASSFDFLVVAYEVIGDPATRKQYDALGPGEIWNDRFEIEKEKRKIKMSALDHGVDPEEFYSTIMEGRAERELEKDRMLSAGNISPQSPIKRHEVNNIEWYRFIDEDIFVEQDLILEWLTEFSMAFRLVGIDDDLKLGFTNRGPCFEVLGLSNIYFVPLWASPSEAIPIVLATERKRQVRRQEIASVGTAS